MEEKIIDLKKTVYELSTQDPEIIKILEELGFRDIARPGMLQTAGRFMTIPKGAKLKGISLDRIKERFVEGGYLVKGESE